MSENEEVEKSKNDEVTTQQVDDSIGNSYSNSEEENGNISSSSSTSDYICIDNEWKEKLMVLKPGDAYEKQQFKKIFLTNISLVSSKEADINEAGILCALHNDVETVIASLRPNCSSQQINLTFNSMQEVMLINKGNRPITLTMLMT